MSVFIAVDTGGTFTDLAGFDSASGRVSYTKSLTTPDNPIRGILDCIAKTGVALDEAALFKHGTTLVINTLLERSGPAIALVTTRGFRDVLELGRGNRTETFNLNFRREPPLVPRARRFELDERMDAAGQTVRPPRIEDLAEVAGRIRESGAVAVAVSFLNAYLNPAHERQVCDWLRERLPGCFVTAGTDLTREWYEYERTATAAANAYAGPQIGSYVARLESALHEHRFAGQLLLMGSNGGVLSAAHAATAPVMLVESGPVGGCIGAGLYGQALGIDDLIAFDMGGTTAKCALVRHGSFDVEGTYHAGGYGRGTPIRAPVLDIVEVGAGGGSIAWLDGQQQLNVGPKSAGSTPGPVCYGRGGTEPTVTDANLVLGRLDAGRFQGGEMHLREDAAREALRERLARPLGYEGEEGLAQLASGILSIAAVKMSEAIKRITVQRGQDPRDFALFAYGGGGPLHAAQLARELAIPSVIIPPEAGNFSAIGMLLADIRRDIGRTLLRRIDDAAMQAMRAVFADLQRELAASIEQDFGAIPMRFERHVEVRFVGQFHTVRMDVAEGEDAAALQTRFRAAYRARFGHASEVAALESVSVHCVVRAATDKPDIESLRGRAGEGGPPARGERAVFHPEAGRHVPTAVYRRDQLPVGFRADGPAIIEEYGSTTVVGTTDRFEVGPLGELRIAIDALRTEMPA